MARIRRIESYFADPVHRFWEATLLRGARLLAFGVAESVFELIDTVSKGLLPVTLAARSALQGTGLRANDHFPPVELGNVVTPQD